LTGGSSPELKQSHLRALPGRALGLLRFLGGGTHLPLWIENLNAIWPVALKLPAAGALAVAAVAPSASSPTISAATQRALACIGAR